MKPKNSFWISIAGGLLAFLTYSCMYAFRKPFTAATFSGEAVFGFDLKIALVIAQLVGYTLSKFVGIKVISELGVKSRGRLLIALLFLAGAALVGFAIAPAPLKVFFIFLNGIPLGMVWGLVFSFLEGRRATEFMGSLLAVSFIFSSGFVKTIGKSLMGVGVSEYWMPVATAAIFFVPACVFVFLLEKLPPPSEEDVRLRVVRVPMNATERRELFSTFRTGLVLSIAVYVCLTVVRDFRDNFISDIWKGLGIDNAIIFSQTETPISIAVLAAMASLMFIKNNRRAVLINHLVVFLAFGVVGLSTWAYNAGQISPVWWMTLNGFGLYLGYIPFNVVFFERIIAAAKRPANVGFLMYTADAFGYLGSLGVLLYKNFASSDVQYENFLNQILQGSAIVGLVLITISWRFFAKKIPA